LSKKALEKFAKTLSHQSESCLISNSGAEDLELGRCLGKHVIQVDERDELGQKRFFPAGVIEHLNQKIENSSYWYDEVT
jgi:hypothetical protein